MSWCKQCGDYDVYGRGCTCRVIGTVWRSDDDEEGSWDLYGKNHDSVETAVERFVKRKHAQDFEFMKYDHTDAFSVRPTDGGPVKFVTVNCELVPSYRAEEVDKTDDVVSEARSRRLRTLKWRRRKQQTA